MTWGFATEPEFERQLEWMREFMRVEVEPLETLTLDWEQLKRVSAPLQAEVKNRGLWAAHLPPELGGEGFGQLKLGLMHEIIGRSVRGPFEFGNQAPDSGNSEILALAGTEEQKERWLWPLLEGTYRSCFAMTERDVAGSDPTLLQTRARREADEWVIDGRKWFASRSRTFSS
jgi:acyl-CoA dehydrogenase